MATYQYTGIYLQQFVALGITTVDVQLTMYGHYTNGGAPVQQTTYIEDATINYQPSGVQGDPPAWVDGIGYYIDVEHPGVSDTAGIEWETMDIMVGRRYTATAETLDLEISQASTNKTQNTARVTLKVENTLGLEVGSSDDTLTPIRDVDDTMVTDEEELHITGRWDEGASVVIQQTHMQPATILCLTANVGVSRT